MKKRQDKSKTTNNIILKDKEMEVLIRELVKRASQNEVKITHLVEAVKEIWREEVPIEQKEYRLTAKEEVYSLKVDKFLAYYEKELEECARLSQDIFNKERYFQILLSMYAVFERESKVTQAQIAEFGKKYSGLWAYAINNEICILDSFFTYLKMSDTNEPPKYLPNFFSFSSRIASNREFLDFKNQYEISRYKVSIVSVMSIWLINKYF